MPASPDRGIRKIETIVFQPPRNEEGIIPSELMQVDVYECTGAGNVVCQDPRVRKEEVLYLFGAFQVEVFDETPKSSQTGVIFIHASNESTYHGYLDHIRSCQKNGIEIPYPHARLGFTKTPIIGRG